MGLDLVELVIEVERAFDVTISNAQAEQAITVGQLYDVVRAQIVERDTTVDAGYSGPYWERYLTLVERELGVPREQLSPEAEFVKDLGAD